MDRVWRFAGSKESILTERSAVFSHILGPVMKFNKVIRLLCFYYNGAFICYVVEYLKISIY